MQSMAKVIEHFRVHHRENIARIGISADLNYVFDEDSDKEQECESENEENEEAQSASLNEEQDMDDVQDAEEAQVES